MRRSGTNSTDGEIRELIPVPKGVLSNWRHESRLSPKRVGAIHDRPGPGSRIGIPVNTQWRRRQDVERIRIDARMFAEPHTSDAFLVAGIALDGVTARRPARISPSVNAGPRALRPFISWARSCHSASTGFVLKINLHADNDEPVALVYWREATGPTDAEFYRTFVKPHGTGHRKNHLPMGCTECEFVAEPTIGIARWHGSMSSLPSRRISRVIH